MMVAAFRSDTVIPKKGGMPRMTLLGTDRVSAYRQTAVHLHLHHYHIITLNNNGISANSCINSLSYFSATSLTPSSSFFFLILFIYNIIIISIGVFHISVSWWSFTGVWVTASLLKTPATEVDRRIVAARSAFVRLKQSLWGRREISTATKGHIYQAIVRTILLYGCQTWPLRAVDLRKLEVFDNGCLRYILRCHRIDRVPTTTLRRCVYLRALPPVLLHRRLRWFGLAARCPEGELIHNVLLPTSLPNWRKRVGGQLKT